jgi:hypothetical protein
MSLFRAATPKVTRAIVSRTATPAPSIALARNINEQVEHHPCRFVETGSRRTTNSLQRAPFHNTKPTTRPPASLRQGHLCTCRPTPLSTFDKFQVKPSFTNAEFWRLLRQQLKDGPSPEDKGPTKLELGDDCSFLNAFLFVVVLGLLVRDYYRPVEKRVAEPRRAVEGEDARGNPALRSWPWYR